MKTVDRAATTEKILMAKRGLIVTIANSAAESRGN
jgi:hypothetical protein